MKKLLLFIFSFIFFSSFAQLDREHWFAPMVDRVGNNSQYQSIYMSTNETTPFKVDIYHNNAVVGTVTISKNNPVQYSIPNSQRNRIITTSLSDLFKPVAMGFYLKGEKPFFVSLRFSIKNHGEIQTSKGTAALGTEFRAVMAPLTADNNYLNFMNSIMATEDNTNVTITDFRSNVQFSDGLSRTQIKFTLNKGQSYIVDGSAYYSQNYTGYIGAKIVSDKPIIIANGNFNGQYAGYYDSSSDILMDQGVPIDKLGQEFVLMKGNGTTTSNMEKGLILATENNTEIYINNGTTPVATLNAGQYYLTDNSAYINQTYSHYNMFIKATKNIYVYQLLAGDSGSSMVATGGFNYIPPLNCYLPKKIDEIGKIEENEYSSNGVPYSLTVPTKLNIITERDATVDVKRNGVSLTLNASNGPFNVLGNNAWVTYSIPNITGNIAVFSSNAVTAGISAGNDAVGYGGYFAGFSSIPLILKTEGDCLPGVKLEVTEGFDSYQWLEKVAGVYIPAPGINNTFEYSPTQAGIYAVKVKQGSCDEIQTRDFKFYNCTTYTNYDYNSCGNETVTPAFALSTQTIDPATVQIVTPPTKGTVTIATDGKVTYTANPGASGSDTFKFTFCGIGTIPDCETVQITINMIEKKNDVLQECSVNGIATYKLSNAAVSPDTNITKTYFKTENGALYDIDAEKILNFDNYTTADTSVYVRIKNTYGCVAVARIDLKSKLAPDVKENLYTALHCDEDIDQKIDGIYKVNLASITAIVLVQASDFVVKYYDDPAKANFGGTDNITGVFSFTADRSVWIRVDAPNGCAPVIREIKLKTGTKLSISDPVSYIKCDDDLSNSEKIKLSDYAGLFTSDDDVTVAFYKTLSDAQNNTPTTSDAQTITGPSTFYYRFKSGSFCDVIGTLNISLKGSTPTALEDKYFVCEGDAMPLKAEGPSVYKKWVWEKGGTVIFTTQNVTLSAGVYKVSFTDLSDCVFTKNITIIDTPKPQLNIAAYSAMGCDINFDGNSDPINFNSITPIIVPNFAANPGLFNVRYYLAESDRNAGNNNTIPNLTNWTFSADTTVYVRVESQYCTFIPGEIHFKFGNNLPLLEPTITANECDDDFDGEKSVNLFNYITEFTAATGVKAYAFATLQDAQNNKNEIINQVTINQSGTYYLRFHKNTYCDVIGKLTINIQIPTKSTTLFNTPINICPEATTLLDPGPGYTAPGSIKWSTGQTSQTISVGVGEYWVDLTNSLGCIYRQHVSVKAVSLPEITGIEIKGSTVTVTVTGGNAPYQYALDGTDYQFSNVFTNVHGDDHRINVISADNCSPVFIDFNVIEVHNVITPNGDGINDFLNLSGLMQKDNPMLQIFDRYGNLMFTGDKNNNFSWDGKSAGKAVATGSYWYVLQWQEPGSETGSKSTGWVLVKSRE